MSSPAGILLIITLFVLIAIAVIVVAALVQRPTSAWRDQWKRNTDDVRRTGVRHMIGEPVQPRLVRFDELWQTESEAGSAYVAAPKIPSKEVVAERLSLHPAHDFDEVTSGFDVTATAPAQQVQATPAPPKSRGANVEVRAVPVPSDPNAWLEPEDAEDSELFEEDTPAVDAPAGESLFARRWHRAHEWIDDHLGVQIDGEDSATVDAGDGPATSEADASASSAMQRAAESLAETWASLVAGTSAAAAGAARWYRGVKEKIAGEEEPASSATATANAEENSLEDQTDEGAAAESVGDTESTELPVVRALRTNVWRPVLEREFADETAEEPSLESADLEGVVDAAEEGLVADVQQEADAAEHADEADGMDTAEARGDFIEESEEDPQQGVVPLEEVPEDDSQDTSRDSVVFVDVAEEDISVDQGVSSQSAGEASAGDFDEQEETGREVAASPEVVGPVSIDEVPAPDPESAPEGSALDETAQWLTTLIEQSPVEPKEEFRAQLPPLRGAEDESE